MARRVEPPYLTEHELRQQFGLRQGGEITLMAGTRFTPAAKQLLQERQIEIRWQDQQGRCFTSADAAPSEQVHPLKRNNQRPQNQCALCQQDVAHKSALMTHLNDQLLVAKTHPRITLRGKLDSCISYTALVQCHMQQLPPRLQSFMADIRSYLGQLMQAEVQGLLPPPPTLGEFSATTVHRWSHQPLQYLGHDHLLPDRRYGEVVAELNWLRSMVRELELSASHTYLDNNWQVSAQGEALIAGLNRLSSAVYVVAILTWQCQNGQQQQLEALTDAPS
ncbi:ethanolamine utilization cob(I)yrinic acid a,c-diamide adenosyltransferase EutT [Ferrimonas lipolytica]|uniref:Ethanolamine utilization cob(I)yrinic acid a,c-diamide adenosyltransferase EutT n=1 Tax=Ferrimonas lipolytica TaxID=2724191 RepID=A0A6H1U9J9_9GAMM|nr:ethanolamine utilization cob(I)yrinic acid a,c-diamide adenosyltransferase EutT [Ferrimonas lipolytica]QIZ75704.1 ethanolamine utilization cob(I)yrinic acid a,c-diamide adenosyltransferase EutT [Ferrimonas lipolytica]